MNQPLKKLSGLSGFVLLFSPFIFTTAFKFILNFPIKIFLVLSWGILEYFTDQIWYISAALVLGILDIIFFVKIFKFYRRHLPHAYFIIYFIGILIVGAVGIILLRTIWYLILGYNYYLYLIWLLSIFIVINFALFSFRYRKGSFLTDELTPTRNNILILLFVTLIIAICFIGINTLYPLRNLPLAIFFAALLVLPYGYWRRKTEKKTEFFTSFVFLLSLQIIIIEIIIGIISNLGLSQGIFMPDIDVWSLNCIYC